MASDIDHLAGVAVCGCGDCQKAVKDALAEFQKLTSAGCIHWYMTQAMIHATIATLIAGDPRIDPAQTARIVGRQRELQDYFVDERTLDYVLKQIEAIDAANALVGGGGKVN